MKKILVALLALTLYASANGVESIIDDTLREMDRIYAEYLYGDKPCEGLDKDAAGKMLTWIVSVNKNAFNEAESAKELLDIARESIYRNYNDGVLASKGGECRNEEECRNQFRESFNLALSLNCPVSWDIKKIFDKYLGGIK